MITKIFTGVIFFPFNFSSVTYLKLRAQFPSKFFDGHERKNEHATIIVHCEKQKRQKKKKTNKVEKKLPKT